MWCSFLFLCANSFALLLAIFIARTLSSFFLFLFCFYFWLHSLTTLHFSPTNCNVTHPPAICPCLLVSFRPFSALSIGIICICALYVCSRHVIYESNITFQIKWILLFTFIWIILIKFRFRSLRVSFCCCCCCSVYLHFVVVLSSFVAWRRRLGIVLVVIVTDRLKWKQTNSSTNGTHTHNDTFTKQTKYDRIAQARW